MVKFSTAVTQASLRVLALEASHVQAGSWEGGWTDPKQMADPVTPAAASFGHMGQDGVHVEVDLPGRT